MMDSDDSEATLHPLRRLRMRLGLSQSQLAEAVGIHRQYVYQIESWREAIGGPTALRVSDTYGQAMKALGITVEDLLRARPVTTEPAA